MIDTKRSVTPVRSVAFETLKPAVVALLNQDRAYLWTWLLKFTKIDGSIVAPAGCAKANCSHLNGAT